VTELLIDQCLPRRLAADLRELGWSVQHVGELGMQRHLDEQILAYATDHGMVIVTQDGDFARLLALPRRAGPSVIHFRIPRATRARLVALLGSLVPQLEAELRAGCIVSVDEAGARVRHLPIRPEP
jgi:predicted nuclease of predicted toxin-antitoxin system